MRIPDGFVSNMHVSGGEAYITWSSSNKPLRILKVKLGNGEVEEILGARVPDYISKHFSKVKFIKYKSFDELEIPTYVFESKMAGKPGPTIIYVHGGP